MRYVHVVLGVLRDRMSEFGGIGNKRNEKTAKKQNGRHPEKTG
jgi:hypothetical protein